MTKPINTGAVVIGRNEGKRLVRCLDSVGRQVNQVIYVDSGSTDDSTETAADMGTHLVELDKDLPFTAARARNAGFAYLVTQLPPPDYVQFIDGDCELQPGWVPDACTFLETNPKAAVVCGRRRERNPDASVYNRLIDQEWDTPVGETRSCGGDSVIRVAALQQVGGFNPDLIAGEEPELCIRLRQAGWTIWRLDAEMTLHDAAMTRFSQWWKRNRRAGHAFAEGAALHGKPPEHHGVRQVRSALVWGVALPAVAVFGAAISPWSLALLLAWPTQILRLYLRDRDWARAAFLTIGKLPEAQGILGYWWGRWRGARSNIIEYK